MSSYIVNSVYTHTNYQRSEIEFLDVFYIRKDCNYCKPHIIRIKRPYLLILFSAPLFILINASEHFPAVFRIRIKIKKGSKTLLSSGPNQQ